MKASEVQTKVMSGARLFVGRFLGEEAREVPSARDGHLMVFHEVKVLNGMEVLSVSIPTPKEAKSAAMVKRLGYKPDTAVVVEFSTLESTKYGLRSRGTVHPLEA